MSTVNQAQVQELLDIVKTQKAELNKAEKPNWVTNCSFSYDKNSGNRINIRTVSTVHELINMLGYLIGLNKNLIEAKQILGVEAELEWLGFSFDDWTSDIKSRVSQLQINEKKEKLLHNEARLQLLVSQQTKDEQELAELMKELKG